MKRNIIVFLFLLISVIWPAGQSNAATIHLKSGIVQTDELPSVAMSGLHQQYGKGSYLVALKGPVIDADKQALLDAGAEIVEYIPDFTFLVRVDHSRVFNLKKLPCVKWVGLFKSAYKSKDDLSSVGESRQYIVALFPGQAMDRIVRKAGARKIECENGESGGRCRVLANGVQLSHLAESGAVAWIEPYVQPILCNKAAGVILGVPEVRQDLGLYGSGQLVGVADAGLDTGDTSTISPDFANRIQKTYALRRPNEWGDLNGHGTHVVGSLLGSGALSGSAPASHSYDASFAGVAPEANLVFQSIGDDGQFVFPPLHLSDLFQPVYDDGVRVHSDSWGSTAHGEYSTYSSEVDQFVWDHKDFTVVFAVGNEGEDKNQNGVIDKDSLYAPSTAKNCIAVGASENNCLVGGYQSGYGVTWSYPAAPIKYDLMSNNIDGLAAFSGRGPTDDGRIKPDICAPGTNIISCRAHTSGISTGWGIYDNNYMYWGGTSMATPQVSGAAALVREYYQKEKSTNPTAALVKATLINSAKDMSPGQYGSGSARELNSVPDSSQGWGRLNVRDALCPDPPKVNEFVDETTGISTGAYRDYQFTIIDASVPLGVTLVWTDYPGAVQAAKELVNDLDLTVISPTGTVYPTGSRDHVNNVEQVKINSPDLGTYVVRVIGYNVPMGPQDYAISVSGGLPSTFVSGIVTSSSGAAVQGAVVSVASSNGVKRVTTNQAGQYITHISPGTYSVQVAKTGWTFTPRAQVVSISDTPAQNIEFQGLAAPGSISGKVTSAVGGVISYTVESPHPYLNNYDRTYTISASNAATKMRVHFAEIDLLSDGDTIYVLDASGTIRDTYTGKGEDVWSSWVNGNVVKVRILSNELGNAGYGFYIDGYETDLIQQGGLSGAITKLNPSDLQVTTVDGGVYSMSQVPAGMYTITPSKQNWTFQPTSKTVEIPAGGSVASVDFLAFPPGSITGEAKIVSSTVASVRGVSSPHPYEENYEDTWQIDAPASTNRMRLHFSTISTEPAWDFVYVMDGNDNIVEIYTADYTDLWSPWINGSTARVMFTSDQGINGYGFDCDKYEAEVVSGSLSGAAVRLTPDGTSTSTSSQGTFTFPEVSAGRHTVVPDCFPWSFDPDSTIVNISAAMQEHVLFYVNAADINSAASVKMIPDNIQVTLKGLAVTAAFKGFFYVEDSNRLSGIRVVSSASVKPGDVVEVTGTMSTVDGERRITATGLTVN
ncbi:MAG: S8 family serine peptidase [Armatimonadota bacterium]